MTASPIPTLQYCYQIKWVKNHFFITEIETDIELENVEDVEAELVKQNVQDSDWKEYLTEEWDEELLEIKRFNQDKDSLGDAYLIHSLY